MSRRIEIELTSARPDGTWTWRAAGAREPKGVVVSEILPGGSKVGDVLRAEVESELDGTTVLNAAPLKAKSGKSGLLEILPSAAPFEAVTQQLAKRERGDRGDRRDRPPRRGDGDRPGRGDGERRPRRDGDGAPGGDRRPPRADGDRRPPRADGDRRPPREGGDRPPRSGDGERRERRPRPNFTPPPELPQRPKPKRLKPGRAHRTAVLAGLPEEQRAVAERALQGGIPAVRQAVNEQNALLKQAGKDEIPAAGLIQMAEQLLPKLRVAEWLDRADAAKADLAELALPDLRSVVASSEDPVVARDESTRALAAELREALSTKQESELLLWLDDITAALKVGRVIRALKLSSQPPKAGVRLPPELATQLAQAASNSLTTDALPDRWAALLEAAAFAPVRAQITATAPPTQSSDDLTATVKRLAPALPQIAALFGIEVAAGASMPKPMRPTRPPSAAKKAAAKPPVKPAAPAPSPQPEAAQEAVSADAVDVDTAPQPEDAQEAVSADAVDVETAPQPEDAQEAVSADAVDVDTAPTAATQPDAGQDAADTAVDDAPAAAAEETAAAPVDETPSIADEAAAEPTTADAIDASAGEPAAEADGND